MLSETTYVAGVAAAKGSLRPDCLPPPTEELTRRVRPVFFHLTR